MKRFIAEMQIYDSNEKTGVMQIRSAEDIKGLYEVFKELEVLADDVEIIPVWTVENMQGVENGTEG